ncbi:MAG: MATE family efflux transporter [Bacillota bacterium]|nr:MAG: MATE family efflux transporter [Bacillota bacterium]
MSKTSTVLTSGTPWKVLLKYNLPLLGSAVFQQIYTIADTVIAGKFAGESALAAVGASLSIVSIFMAVALGANAGCAVMVARYFGANDKKKTLSAVLSSAIGFFALGIVLLIAGIFTSGPLLRLLGTPESVMEESVLYLNVYIAGFPSLIMYNLATGIYSALGDSKTPFFFLVGSSLGNILLDYIFTATLGWGVAGVAWATFVTQTAACLLTIVFLAFRLKKIHAEAKSEAAEQETDRPTNPAFSFALLGAIFLAALPVILQNSFISVGNLFIQRIVNSYGESALAGYTAGSKIIIFCCTCFNTLGTGLTNYSSQNLGAGEIKRIRQGFWCGMAISAIVALALFAAVFTFSETFVRLFLDDASSEATLRYGMNYIRIVSPFFVLVTVKISADCVVRGCGGNFGFMVSTFTDLLLRVAFSFILSPAVGLSSVFWGWDIGWSAGTVIALIFYCNIPALKRLRKNKAAA